MECGGKVWRLVISLCANNLVFAECVVPMFYVCKHR